MPELPEVETVTRSLAPLVGKTFIKVKVRNPNLRSKIPVKSFEQVLTGKKVRKLERRSKYVVMHLSDGSHLIVHLGMSGRFFLDSPHTPYEKHLHVYFDIGAKKQLRYVDPRRFGIVEHVPKGELDGYPRFLKLGVEPLTDDFDGDVLYVMTKVAKKPIKNLIMDAQKVVGIGNIYATEALFLSGIRPNRLANGLAKKRIHALAANCKKVLADAIEQGGTTINDFKDGNQQEGYFQVFLHVYGREGEPCLVCKKPIKNMKLAGRSSFYCSQCQS